MMLVMLLLSQVTSKKVVLSIVASDLKHVVASERWTVGCYCASADPTVHCVS